VIPMVALLSSSTKCCVLCAMSTSMSLTELSTKSQQTFITTGFVDWKKAIEKFDDHEKSAHHKHAVLQHTSALPVNAQLSMQKVRDQAIARTALVKLISSVRFLARQGIPLHGHLMQLLQL